MRKNILKRNVKSKLFPIISLLLIVGVLGSLVAIFARNKTPDGESSLETSYGGGFIGDNFSYNAEYSNSPGVLTYSEGARGGENDKVGIEFKALHTLQGNKTTLTYPVYDNDSKMHIDHKEWGTMCFAPLSTEGDIGVFETDFNVKENFGYAAGVGSHWFGRLIIKTQYITKYIYFNTVGLDVNGEYYGIADNYSSPSEYKLQYGREYSLKVITSSEGLGVYVDGICVYRTGGNFGNLQDVGYEFRAATYSRGTVVEFDNTYCNRFVAE